MWKPTADFVVVTSAQDRKQYLEGGGPLDQWPHRIGRHEAAAEFPTMLVRQFLREQGYAVYVSGLSEKITIDSYSLAMFPGKRRDAAFSNARRVLGLSDQQLEAFLGRVNESRSILGLGSHGGDPDLLVQHLRRPADRFFVEVKASSKGYKDRPTKQQEVVFPIIRARLKIPIFVATVHILGTSGRARPKGDVAV